MSLPRELFGTPAGPAGTSDRDSPGNEQQDELLLRCVACQGRLIYFPQERFLFCPASRLRYAITEEGIPVMLLDEAETLSEGEAQALLARARELKLPIPA